MNICNFDIVAKVTYDKVITFLPFCLECSDGPFSPSLAIIKINWLFMDENKI